MNPDDSATILGQTMHVSSGAAQFPTTRWTLVAAAGDRGRPDSRRALESLCEAYWYPLYAYARRRGDTPEEAQDHTQDFFARFLERDYFDRADPDRGRFRSLRDCGQCLARYIAWYARGRFRTAYPLLRREKLGVHR